MSVKLQEIREKARAAKWARYELDFAHVWDMRAEYVEQDLDGLLVGRGNVALNKTFVRSADGRYTRTDTSANAKSWRFLPVVVSDHNAMADLLTRLASRTHECLLRAYLHETADVYAFHPRQYHASERGSGNGGPLVRRTGRWLILDLDGVAFPPGIGYHDPAAMMAWVSSAVVPEAFRGASFAYQLSASAALTKNDFRGHLFFKAVEPIHGETWRQILVHLKTSGCDKLDPASGSDSQICFSGSPLIVDDDGVVLDDPLEGRRIGVYLGLRPAVDLSALSALVSTQTKARAARGGASGRLGGASGWLGEDDIARQARLAALTMKDTAIVAKYMARWEDYERYHLGDGPGRKGYNTAVFALLCRAIECGETNPDRLLTYVSRFVMIAARKRGELERGSAKPPSDYLEETYLWRTFENAWSTVYKTPYCKD